MIVTVQDSSVFGQASAVLQAGTTTVNLNANRNQPPSIGPIPEQFGVEDEPWELNLDPHLSDPDTPVTSLKVIVYNDHVSVAGHVLTFLYPEGVVEDTVVVYVQDASSTVTRQVEVSVTPVNDPPLLSEIPTIAVMEGSSTCIDLSPYVEDPDDPVGDLAWQVTGGEFVNAWMEGASLLVSAPQSQVGMDTLSLVVSDPGGLSDNKTLDVDVGANLTALTKFFHDQIDQLNSQIALLEEENSNLTAEVACLLEGISELEDDNVVLESLLEGAILNVSQLLGQLSGLEVQGMLDAETIANLEAERLNLSSQVSSLEQSLEATIASYDDVISDLNSTRLALEAQILFLRGRIDEINATLSGMESNASLQGMLIANLTAERARLESLIGGKEQDILDLEDLAKDLEGQILKIEEEKALARAAVDEIERSLEELRQRNSDLLSQIGELTVRTPAQFVGPNTTSNLSSIDQPGLIESLVARAAHLARDSTTLVSKGMRSTTGMLIIAVIAIVSAVTIAARTSWVQMGSRAGSRSKARDYWQNIQNRTMKGGSAGIQGVTPARPAVGKDSSTRSKPSGKRPGVRAKERDEVQSGQKTKKSVVIRSPGHARPRRMTFVSSKPVSIKQFSPGPDTQKKAPPSPLEPVAPKPGVTDRAASKPISSEPAVSVPISPKPVTIPKATPQTVDRPRSEGKPRDSDVDKKLKDGSPGLSKVDKEYIQSLIELGFTKEAEEELRKRTSDQ